MAALRADNKEISGLHAIPVIDGLYRDRRRLRSPSITYNVLLRLGIIAKEFTTPKTLTGAPIY